MCSTNSAALELLSLPEDVLKHVSCDLDRGLLMYKKSVIFEDGEFKDCETLKAFPELPADLAELPLLSMQRRYSEPEWKEVLTGFYSVFSRTVNKRSPKPVNLMHAKNSETDFLLASDYFHQARLAIELFVLFNSQLGMLEWKTTSHFFTSVCDGLIIYRKWVERT